MEFGKKMHRRVGFGVAVACVALAAGTAGAATYAGNGGTGFGGVVGNGSLDIVDGGSTVNFTFTPGASFGADNLVLYFDTVAGGVGSNSTFTDTSDGGRTAISGLSGSGRSLVTLPAGFGADFASSVDNGFAGLFNLATPSNFGFIASGGLTPTGGGVVPRTFSFNKADLGLPTSGNYSFSFVGTLISDSAFRANETIGVSGTLVDPTNVGTAPNAGFTGTQTFLVANTFAVPEPATLGVIASAALAALRRSRRTA